MALRGFASLCPSDMKKGDIFLFNGHYCEYVASQSMKQGRTTASIGLEYYDFHEKKFVSQKVGGATRVEQLDVDKSVVQITSVHKKTVTAVKDSLEEVLIPMEALDGSIDPSSLKAGTRLSLVMYRGNVIKAVTKDIIRKTGKR